jgi:hypothetical protein
LQFELQKSQQFSNDVILVDGSWGTGKSAITPVISAFAGVEKKRIDPIIEYTAILNWLGKLDDDAAQTLFANYADYFTYHNHIGREVNLRWTDDSGFRNSPGASRYISRLFRRDGDHLVSEIESERPATLLVSDFAVVAGMHLKVALGNRLKLIEVVRHPLYLVNYWDHYLRDFDRSREFTLATEIDGHRVPWIVAGWSDEYLKATHFDRVLLLIARAQGLILTKVTEASEFLVVPFEHYVTETDVWIDRLGAFLGRELHYRIGRVKRRHRLPRMNVSAGRKSNRRSWISTVQKAENEIYQDLFTSVRSQSSKRCFDEFCRTISEYESRFTFHVSIDGDSE